MKQEEKEREEEAKGNKGNIPFAATTEKLNEGMLNSAHYQSERDWLDRLEIEARRQIDAEWEQGLNYDKIDSMKQKEKKMPDPPKSARVVRDPAQSKRDRELSKGRQKPPDFDPVLNSYEQRYAAIKRKNNLKKKEVQREMENKLMAEASFKPRTNKRPQTARQQQESNG